MTQKFGLPQSFTSDGGPFNTSKLSDYLTSIRFQHMVRSSYSPKSNGMRKHRGQQIKTVLEKCRNRAGYLRLGERVELATSLLVICFNVLTGIDGLLQYINPQNKGVRIYFSLSILTASTQ